MFLNQLQKKKKKHVAFYLSVRPDGLFYFSSREVETFLQLVATTLEDYYEGILLGKKVGRKVDEQEIDLSSLVEVVLEWYI